MPALTRLFCDVVLRSMSKCCAILNAGPHTYMSMHTVSMEVYGEWQTVPGLDGGLRVSSTGFVQRRRLGGYWSDPYKPAPNAAGYVVNYHNGKGYRVHKFLTSRRSDDLIQSITKHEVCISKHLETTHGRIVLLFWLPVSRSKRFMASVSTVGQSVAASPTIQKATPSLQSKTLAGASLQLPKGNIWQ